MQFPPRLARFAFLSVPILRTKDQAVFGQRLHFCENGDRCRRDPGLRHSLEAVLELAKGAPTAQLFVAAHESVPGTKRTSSDVRSVVANRRKADIAVASAEV